MADNVAFFYAGWRQMNDRLIEVVGSLSDEELAWVPAPGMWPVWALVGHLCGARAYWLCAVLGEPGVERTPFTDPNGAGWEDDPTHPRGADELVHALRSTWTLIDACLERWTPEMLRVEFRRQRGAVVQLHTRQSVLIRLLTHDASHSGEISHTLGSHGRGEVDLWSRLSRSSPPT